MAKAALELVEVEKEILPTLDQFLAALDGIIELQRKYEKAKGLVDDSKKIINETVRVLFGDKKASVKRPEGTVTTYWKPGYSTDWEAVGEAVKMTADEAKAKFTKVSEAERLSVRVTPK